MSFLGPFHVGGPPLAMGKVPRHPEFLHNRTVREPQRSFDDWLEAGMVQAHALGDGWSATFARSEVQAFVWCPPVSSRSESALSGILYPSCDSVGRQFPLAFAYEVPIRLIQHALPILPLALGDLLEGLYGATRDFANQDVGELRARLARVPPTSSHVVDEASAAYDAWCAATRLEQIWTTTFREHPHELADRALHNLRSARVMSREVALGSAKTAIRIPLGVFGLATACFWLDVMRRLQVADQAAHCIFWTIEDGSLVAAIRDPHPGVLPSLFIPASPYVQLLEAAPETHPLRTPTPTFQRPHNMLVSEFLHSLRP